MDGIKISEAARRTGFTESALRYYERRGVVVPDRTETGYRLYRDADLDSLRFVARARRLGLSLDDTSGLLELLAGDECAPVQGRMRVLVTERIAETQTKIAELVGFVGELREVAGMLATHTPHGPCDDTCGCHSDTTASDSTGSGAALAGAASPHVSCTIDPAAAPERMVAWQQVFAAATARDQLNDGVRLVFDRTTDVVGLARLAEAEQTCCDFFSFSLGVASDRVTLDVTGPPAARSVIAAMG